MKASSRRPSTLPSLPPAPTTRRPAPAPSDHASNPPASLNPPLLPHLHFTSLFLQPAISTLVFLCSPAQIARQRLLSSALFVIIHERLGLLRTLLVFAAIDLLASPMKVPSRPRRPATVAATRTTINSQRRMIPPPTATTWSPFAHMSRYVTSALLHRLNSLVGISLIGVMFASSMAGFVFFSYEIGVEGKGAVISLKDLCSKHTTVIIESVGEQVMAYLMLSAVSAVVPMANHICEDCDNIFMDATATTITTAFSEFVFLAASAAISGHILHAASLFRSSDCALGASRVSHH